MTVGSGISGFTMVTAFRVEFSMAQKRPVDARRESSSLKGFSCLAGLTTSVIPRGELGF
jgi:hypothetical protein